MRPVIRRWVIAVIAVMVALYAPFGWLLEGYPWGDYKLQWIVMWPILPGLLPVAAVLRPSHTPEWVMFLLMGGITLWIIAGLAWLGSRSMRWLVVAIIAALVYSGVGSFFADALFRA